MAFDGHGSVSTSTEPKLKPVRPLGMINSHNPITISHLTNNKTVGWGGGYFDYWCLKPQRNMHEEVC